MEARSEECAKVIALEAAKSIRNAREEMNRTVQTYRFCRGSSQK